MEQLPRIGRHLSYTIEALVRTGEFRTLSPQRGNKKTPPSCQPVMPHAD